MEGSNNNKMIFEINELCSALNIGKNTAYELLNTGEIDAFKIGTVWKIPKSSVEDYIKSKCGERKVMCKIIK